MENNDIFDTKDIFVYIWKKRKLLLIATILGFVVSIIASLALDNYYRAENYIFPTSFIAPSTVNNHINQETDPLKIGNEDDLERTIQILRSEIIFNKIIQKFNLGDHYKIEKDKKYYKTLVRNKLISNTSFNKTSFQGIKISVEDKDPKMAADIANEFSELLDSIIYNMQVQRSKEAYEIAVEAYNSEKKYLDKLEDSLDIFRQLGLLDYGTELDRYTEAYAKSIGRNTINNSSKEFFSNKFELLKKYGKPVKSLVKKIDITTNNTQNLHLRLAELEQNINQPLTHKYTISEATAPEKKAYPKRSVIVILSTLGTFIFALGFLFLLDYFRKIKSAIEKS
ncbi:MAG: Wzz/FepE/Etk N-terminal domain-containing protein [Saprospiraceae bacterium]